MLHHFKSFLICYAATSLLLWVYSHYIRKPLTKIMKGASEYAGGNLEYKIDVVSEDEMGTGSITIHNSLMEAWGTDKKVQMSI